MKKCIENKNNFKNYANHLNSLYDSNKNKSYNHNMIVDSYDGIFRAFYNLYPVFGIMEANEIMEAVNNDYQMYIDWMEDG